jgi:hypothetical protein
VQRKYRTSGKVSTRIFNDGEIGCAIAGALGSAVALGGLSKAMDPRATIRLKKAGRRSCCMSFAPFIYLRNRDFQEFASSEIYVSTKLLNVGACKRRVVRFWEMT